MLGEDIAASGALAIIVTIAGVLIVALEPTPLQYMQHEDVELNHSPASTRTVCQACGTQALANADAHSFCSSCGAPKDKPGIGTQKATILPKATMLPHPPTPSRLVREMSSLLPTSGLLPRPYTLVHTPFRCLHSEDLRHHPKFAVCRRNLQTNDKCHLSHSAQRAENDPEEVSQLVYG